jgi:hypothetical protein
VPVSRARGTRGKGPTRELEPHFIYERAKAEFNIETAYASSPEDMAVATIEMYFKDPPCTAAKGGT